MVNPPEGRRLLNLRPPGLSMRLELSDVTPIATCECGRRCFGDSINDAVLAWTAHVTSTPDCRVKL